MLMWSSAEWVKTSGGSSGGGGGGGKIWSTMQYNFNPILYQNVKKLSEFSLYLSLTSLPGKWRQWSLLLEWISSEPDEIPLFE